MCALEIIDVRAKPSTIPQGLFVANGPREGWVDIAYVSIGSANPFLSVELPIHF